jgi:23S rRNA (uracil1939-C5)-methyltransferase
MTETVVRIAARGDGVTDRGRHVPLAAPGDMIGDDGALIEGPQHRVPPCRHFPECGGCQLQQLDNASYSAFVRDRVAGTLAGQGLAAEVREPLISRPNTRRRATLHVGPGLLGFHAQASHRIVDMRECHVLLPELFALVAPLRRMVAERFARASDVYLARVDQGVDVVIAGVPKGGLAAAEALTEFAARHELARLSVDEGLGAETRWEPQPVTVTLGGVAVPFPAASFLQATEEGEAALVGAVREALGGATIVADLFAGLGTFAFALSGKVYAAEGARDAVLALKAAAGASGRAVFAEHRDLFRRPLTPAELDRFEGVVLDPPRAGAREQVVQLASARTPRVAYVSCNPSSFARDAKTFCEGGYRLEWVQPVGQFLWSTHVELAASFTRG